jgi:large subunit ribosomal protein L32
MAVPKFKHSKHRKRIRRSHDALTAVPLVPCGNCGAPGPRHRICAQCGHYPVRGTRGTRQVVIPGESEG